MLQASHAHHSRAPLLFVDVDGVISLFGFAHHGHLPDGRFESVDGIPHFISACAGEHLRTLAERYELVWCTGWEEKANEYLPHLLGLDAPLPYLSFDRNPGRGHGQWKLAAIEACAGPVRPLAWIDDAHDDACAAWAQARASAAATLLVTTDPATGVTAAEVERLLTWERELREAAAA